MKLSDCATLTDLEEKLSKEIDALEQKRADLEAVRRVLSLFTPSVVVGGRAVTTDGASDSPRSGEVGGSVMSCVHAIPNKTFTIKDVEGALLAQGKGYLRSSVRAALGRMEARGDILVNTPGRGRRPTRYKLPLETFYEDKKPERPVNLPDHGKSR